jgi:hypothetical protein
MANIKKTFEKVRFIFGLTSNLSPFMKKQGLHIFLLREKITDKNNGQSQEIDRNFNVIHTTLKQALRSV